MNLTDLALIMQEHVDDAWKKLAPESRAMLRPAINALKTLPSCGEKTALEVLARLGLLLEREDWIGKQNQRQETTQEIRMSQPKELIR